MKASAFPRMYRVYDLDKSQMFYPEDLITLGFALSPDGLPMFTRKDVFFNCLIMWFSGQKDSKDRAMFEEDVCKVDIKNEFGSILQEYAVMRWSKDNNCFMLQMPALVGGTIFNIDRAEVLGNTLDNKELAELVKPKIANEG